MRPTPRSAGVVLVTETAFHPPYQGDSARVAAIIRYLRERGWRVSVVHFHDRAQHHADYAAMAQRCERLEVYRASDSELAPRRGGGLDAWCPAGFAALVAQVVDEEAADVVIAQFVFFSRCLEGLPAQVVRVLDADNSFDGRAELYRRAGLAYDWFSTDPVEEERGLARAELILAIQEREYERFVALAPGRVMLVVHARDAVALPPPDGAQLLFVGAGNVENADGLRRFLDTAWPRVLAAHPGARLCVAGGVAHTIADRSWPSVDWLGVVDDLTAVYAASSLVINPIAIGTGLKIKTVDALCHGRCLLSLPAGVQGLERFPDSHVCTSDLAEMATAAIELLSSPETLRARGRAAFDFASRYFAPDQVLGALERRLRGSLRRDVESGEPDRDRAPQPPAHARGRRGG